MTDDQVGQIKQIFLNLVLKKLKINVNAMFQFIKCVWSIFLFCFKGQSESFSTKFCCALCLIEKSQMRTATTLRGIGHRTNDNFYAALHNTDPDDPQFLTQTMGIVRDSALNSLRYFKIPENIGADPFHDLNEGVCVDAIDEAIKILVRTTSLSKAEIVSRITSYNFGTLDLKYRPRKIHHLSGVQTVNIVVRFNLIFGDLMTNENKPIFDLMATLTEIIKITYSTKINQDQLKKLNRHVTELLSIWTQKLNLHIKPKMHFLLHYAEIIEKLGPLALMETSSYERKHRFFTKVVEKNGQFLNVLKTCSERHQLWWSHRWSNMKPFHRLDFKNTTIPSIDWTLVEPFSDDVLLDLEQPIEETDSAHLIHQYQKNLCIAKKTDDAYQFFLIDKILIQNESLFFICKALETRYNQFYAAYQILQQSHLYMVVTFSSLYTKLPFAIQTPYSKNEKYILCKKNII